MKITSNTGTWRYRRVLAGTALTYALALAGCGGGGGGSGPDENTDTTYSGTVEAPGGQIAQLRTPGALERVGEFLMPSTVAAVTGLQPVPEVEVELLRLDNNGTVADVVTTVTADGNGVFTLDSELAPSADHVFRVNASGGGTMRVPMARAEVDINPATERVVQAMESAIDNGASLDNWTPEEVESLVVKAVESDVDLSSCGTIDDCVVSAKEQVPTVEEDTQTLADNDGLSGPDGEFAFHAVELAHSQPYWEVGHYLSKLTLTFDGGTLEGTDNTSNDDWWRADKTGMHFDTGDSESFGPLDYSLGNVRLIFSAAAIDGGYSADGQVTALLFHDAWPYDGGDMTEYARGLAIGVKKSSSAPSIAGDYNLVGFGAAVGADQPDSQSGWRRYETLTRTATANGGTLALDSASGTRTRLDLLAASNTGIGQDGATTHEPITDAAGSASFSVGADGALTVGGMEGWAHRDGDFFYLTGRDEFDDPGAALDAMLGVQAGSGMANGDLQGTYHLYVLEGELFTSEDGLMASKLTAVFDGAGGLALSGVDYESDVNMNSQASSEIGSSTFSETGTYSVTSNGKVDLDGASGAVTPDGEILILASEGSEGDSHWHSIVIGFRESAQ